MIKEISRRLEVKGHLIDYNIPWPASLSELENLDQRVITRFTFLWDVVKMIKLSDYAESIMQVVPELINIGIYNEAGNGVWWCRDD